MKKRLVIIPAFNEVGSIERTVEDIKKNAPSFDYVIINDHSMDGTKELCDRLGYNMVTLSINSGIGAAVQTGYQKSKDKTSHIGCGKITSTGQLLPEMSGFHE